MESWLAYVRGPVFLATFLFMILALFRLAALHVLAMRAALQRSMNSKVNAGVMIMSVVQWLVPSSHVFKARPMFTLTSFAWHVVLILTPLLFVSHVLLWERGLATFIPYVQSVNFPDVLELNKHLGDALTLAVVVLTAIMFVFRAANPASRALSEPIDYVLLALLAVPFVTGFLAAHPAMNPVPYNFTMLLHIRR